MKTPTIISIVGQTATGKTELALRLANELLQSGRTHVDILSADSRQVYRDLAILSGADIPSGFQKKQTHSLPHFENADDTLALHGVACIPSDAKWSAGHFRELFQALLEQQTSDTALIIVGGTGLYHQQIFQPAETLGVTPNPQLREALSEKSLDELQAQLQQLWPQRWQAMNNSDRQNPRRLIRAIEIAQSSPTSAQQKSIQPSHQIGLQLPAETLRQKIHERIKQRWAGALKEVEALEKRFPAKSLPSKTILGYEQLAQHLSGQLTADQAQQLWLTAELQYAKRQLTWWKKQKAIEWLTPGEGAQQLLFAKKIL